jgi:hypothetical protein
MQSEPGFLLLHHTIANRQLLFLSYKPSDLGDITPNFLCIELDKSHMQI